MRNTNTRASALVVENPDKANERLSQGWGGAKASKGEAEDHPGVDKLVHRAMEG